MEMFPVFGLATRDLLRRRMLLIAMVPFMLSLILLVGVYGGMMTGLLSLASGTMPAEDLPAWLQALTSLPLIGDSLREVILVSLGLVLGIAGFFLISQVFVITALLIAGLFTHPIVTAIHRLNYPDLPMQGHAKILPVFFAMAVRVLGYGMLVLITLPLLLFPAVGVFAVNGALFLLFRSLLLIDVGSNMLDPAGYRALVKKRGGAWPEMLILYLLSLVPILNLVVPVYAVIVTTHILFRRFAAARADAPAHLRNA